MIDRNLVGVDVNRDFNAVAPDTIDPRLGRTDDIRDRMIARRRKAGLTDYPDRPLATQADVDRILVRSKAESPRRPAPLVAD